MKTLAIFISLFTGLSGKSQLMSFVVDVAVDSALYSINPSTGDTIKLTKLARTIYQGVGTGTAYTVTATSGLVTFGTTSPSITIARKGTYLLMWNVRTDYAAATIAVSRNMIYKIRRTNNTAADIFMSGFATPVMTLLTFSGPDISRQFVYNAAAGDVLEIWASISGLPSIGSVTISEASIIALRLY